MSKETTKPVLLDRANDVSAFASSNPNRIVLQGVHANGEGVEATDGTIYIRVPYVQIDPAEFPPVKSASDERKCALLPVKALKEALKTIPKSNLPVLNTVRLSTVEETYEKAPPTLKAQLATTDLDAQRVIETRCWEGEYPATQGIIPEHPKNVKRRIAINALNLKRIAEYALAHGANPNGCVAPPVVFEFAQATESIKFEINLVDGRKAEGCVMPVRLQ